MNTFLMRPRLNSNPSRTDVPSTGMKMATRLLTPSPALLALSAPPLQAPPASATYSSSVTPRASQSDWAEQGTRVVCGGHRGAGGSPAVGPVGRSSYCNIACYNPGGQYRAWLGQSMQQVVPIRFLVVFHERQGIQPLVTSHTCKARLLCDQSKSNEIEDYA